MRSHDQSLDVPPKLRKTKLLLSRTRANQSSSRRSRSAISCDKRFYNKGTKRNLLSGRSVAIDTNDSDVITCDIDELFCENSNASDEKTICPRISSSTELNEDNDVDVCSTCKNYTECHLKNQQSCTAMKIREPERELMNIQDEEHLNYYEDDVDGEMTSSSTGASIEREDTPILVDLTNEESKQVTWKQTILKQFGEDEESSKSGENVVTESDISSRDLHFAIRQNDAGAIKIYHSYKINNSIPNSILYLSIYIVKFQLSNVIFC